MPHSTLNSLRDCWRSTGIAAWGSVSVDADGKCLCCSVIGSALGKCQFVADTFLLKTNTLLLKPVFVSVILSCLFRTNPGYLSKQEPRRYEFQLGPVLYPPGDLGNITYPLPASVSFSVKPGKRFLYPRTAGRTNDNMHKVGASWRNRRCMAQEVRKSGNKKPPLGSEVNKYNSWLDTFQIYISFLTFSY